MLSMAIKQVTFLVHNDELFHPFGSAVDIVVIEHLDGTFKPSPRYVRFGKFQGVFKAREKIIDINVNGIDGDLLREVDVEYGDENDDNRSCHLNGMQIQECLRPNSCNYDSENRNVNAGARSRGSFLGSVFGRKSIEKSEVVLK
ncbi:hypothetical protein HN51_026982 [Arachis hypogaea]